MPVLKTTMTCIVFVGISLLISVAVVVTLAGELNGQMSNGESIVDKRSDLQFFLLKLRVCRRRFQQCVQVLSNEFCLTPGKSVSFYIWARRMASKIMNGSNDGHAFGCSAQFIQQMNSKPLSQLTEMVKL